MSRKLTPDVAVQFPAVVVVDTREQSGFEFAGIRSDVRDGGGPLVVLTERRTLQSGDYSLVGMEDKIAVERKGISDLFNTIGQNRERFERELSRLNEMRFASVVVEADWWTILYEPPPHSQMSPKTVWRSIIAWQQRFVRVHWALMPDRRHAELWTLRVLERAWRDAEKQKRKTAETELETSNG